MDEGKNCKYSCVSQKGGVKGCTPGRQGLFRALSRTTNELDVILFCKTFEMINVIFFGEKIMSTMFLYGYCRLWRAGENV